MTHDELTKFLDNFGKEILDTIRAKNSDYAGASRNAFAAFDEAAAVLGLTREQVWAVYYMKHVQAVMRYIKTGGLMSESIMDRLTDLTAYPMLLAGMVSEGEDK